MIKWILITRKRLGNSIYKEYLNLKNNKIIFKKEKLFKKHLDFHSFNQRKQ